MLLYYLLYIYIFNIKYIYIFIAILVIHYSFLLYLATSWASPGPASSTLYNNAGPGTTGGSVIVHYVLFIINLIAPRTVVLWPTQIKIITG